MAQIKSVYVWFEFPSTQSNSFKRLVMPRTMTDISRLRGFIREYKQWFKELEDRLVLENNLQNKLRRRNASIAEIRLIGTHKDKIELRIPIIPSAVSYFVDNARNRFKYVLINNSIVLPRKPERIYIVSPNRLQQVLNVFEVVKDDIANVNNYMRPILKEVAEKLEELLRKYNIEVRDWDLVKESIEMLEFHEPRLTIIPVVIGADIAAELNIDEELYKDMLRSYVREVAQGLLAELRPYIMQIKEGKAVRTDTLVKRIKRIQEIANEVGIDISDVADTVMQIVRNPAKLKEVAENWNEFEEEILSRL